MSHRRKAKISPKAGLRINDLISSLDGFLISQA